jgi:glyoxalase family protein
MLSQIEGIHHITSMARNANENNRFFTGILGLRRVKKTVNFDRPDVYHLYYGDALGAPGTVMTYFPFPNIGLGQPGTGEVGTTVFAVPEGTLRYWRARLQAKGVRGLSEDTRFGEARLLFSGPDGDGFALIEVPGDNRPGWESGCVDRERALRGFQSATLRLTDIAATAELLMLMGYAELGREGDVTRLVRVQGNGAHVIDLEEASGVTPAVQGAGSVHHIAFAVADVAAQVVVRTALSDAGFRVTPQIDRDYFQSVYFRSPGGVLFEIATNDPGFTRDEAPEHLGEGLMLPAQHSHLRARLETDLEPIRD